jgi:hypothetical protein
VARDGKGRAGQREEVGKLPGDQSAAENPLYDRGLYARRGAAVKAFPALTGEDFSGVIKIADEPWMVIPHF